MSLQMVSATLAGEMMEPMRSTAAPDDSTASALEAMEAENLPLLFVVDRESGQYLGVVLRKALQNGCVRMDHDPSTCRVHKHLNASLLHCLENEALDEELRAALAREPVIVVDAAESPVGFIPARSS